MTLSRDEAAKAFAEKMPKWRFLGRGEEPRRPQPFFGIDEFEFDGKPTWMSAVDFPAPDALPHSHMEFVGRVAEAIGADPALYRQRFESDGEIVNGWCVYFEIGDQIEGEALDLSHAALLAALAALEER